MSEIWHDIPEYEGRYKLHENNKIILSINRQRKPFTKIIRGSISPKGYHQFTLRKNGVANTYNMHQLVAMTFLGYKKNGRNIVVHHKDENRLNNHRDNLEITLSRTNTAVGRALQKRKTSKYTGVSWYKSGKKWVARIKIGHLHVHLGLFDDEYEAHLAYQRALAMHLAGYSIKQIKSK